MGRHHLHADRQTRRGAADGMVTVGRPRTLNSPHHPIVDMWGRGTPSISTTRVPMSPAWSWGNAGIAVTGHSSTSTSSNHRAHDRRARARSSARASQARCVRVAGGSPSSGRLYATAARTMSRCSSHNSSNVPGGETCRTSTPDDFTD
ncbi:hypothetical protein [Amycolatopsis sp. SID8362]|uniref:hypothetical protein n=1 Tax=Amycolatopsis sp. SID8362 TaxID=2690346 RepID=UPI001EF3A028|nr:hypothetical protein [Amycolatopsis sp. SID8362]